MAAIDKHDKAGAIIAAALCLPGVMAHAQSAPEHGEIAVKYLQYQDSQPGLDRIRVKSPSIYLLVPVSPKWSVETSATYDDVSGATPRYHSAISGATMNMDDKRKAGDMKVTHYRDRSSYSVGASKSKERDYDSNAASFGASFSSPDNNRTWHVGLGHSSDKIASVNDRTLHKKKRTTELMGGITQVLSKNDLVQINLTYNQGKGFYSDPYKLPDVRPGQRKQSIALLRWNRHISGLGATARTSYRYYSDSFGIKAHTMSAEWVQPFGRFSLTPSLRYYTQSAAKFYYAPVYDPGAGAPYPVGYLVNRPEFLSPDQRLSAFGAITAGLKLTVQLADMWTTDLKVERYEQRSEWRVGGQGSWGIDPFSALFMQIGVNKRF